MGVGGDNDEGLVGGTVGGTEVAVSVRAVICVGADVVTEVIGISRVLLGTIAGVVIAAGAVVTVRFAGVNVLD